MIIAFLLSMISFFLYLKIDFIQEEKDILTLFKYQMLTFFFIYLSKFFPAILPLIITILIVDICFFFKK